MLYVRYTDKSGRGAKYFRPLEDEIDDSIYDDDEVSYDGEILHDWLQEDREDGDVWENNANRYEIVEQG